MNKQISITHRPTNTLLAAGTRGWDITPFEGNFYIRRKCLRTDQLKLNGIPGLCPYKFIYVWADLHVDSRRYRNIGWCYVLPNPLLPFIIWRMALPGDHPDLKVVST